MKHDSYRANFSCVLTSIMTMDPIQPIQLGVNFKFKIFKKNYNILILVFKNQNKLKKKTHTQNKNPII